MKKSISEANLKLKQARIHLIKWAWIKRLNTIKPISPKPRRKARGQSMMEYIILVALLAVGSIPVVTLLGNVFRDRVMNAADKMVNNKGGYHSQGRTLVQEGKSKVRKNMGNFHK